MNEYPTESELRKIKALDKPGHSMEEMVVHLRSVWWMPEWGFISRGRSLALHTGGWSGNEDVINQLEKTMFWTFAWEKSFRGGHYYFKLPPWWKKKSVVIKPEVKP